MEIADSSSDLRMNVLLLVVGACFLVLFVTMVLLIELVIWIKRKTITTRVVSVPELNERLVEAPYRHHCQSPKPAIRDHCLNAGR
jgi:hypothetical protein